MRSASIPGTAAMALDVHELKLNNVRCTLEWSETSGLKPTDLLDILNTLGCLYHWHYHDLLVNYLSDSGIRQLSCILRHWLYHCHRAMALG